MSMTEWDAVALLAEKCPEGLAVLASKVARLEREIEAASVAGDRLRRDMAQRTEASALERARAVTEARRAAEMALGDGWHTLRVGGDFLVRDGEVARARCEDAAKRHDLAHVLKHAFNVWLGPWTDDGEAEVCNIPF